MLALTLSLAVLSQIGPDKPVDIKESKADLGAVTDGKGHFVIYNSKQPLSGPTFYGDGTSFNLVRTIGGGSSGTESFGLTFWDPRVFRSTNSYATFDMKDEGRDFSITCADKVTAMKKVSKDELPKLLEAKFFGSRWTRRPDRLFRDDTGTYYFVDRLRSDDDGDRRDWRVFIGPRGKMKLAALKDVVDDAQGQIFATKDGSLRLVTGAESKWIKGKVELKLTEVDLELYRNARMVYMELGPYIGERLGTPCDDML